MLAGRASKTGRHRKACRQIKASRARRAEHIVLSKVCKQERHRKAGQGNVRQRKADRLGESEAQHCS
jgi:hypothetical protein